MSSWKQIRQKNEKRRQGEKKLDGGNGRNKKMKGGWEANREGGEEEVLKGIRKMEGDEQMAHGG